MYRKILVPIDGSPTADRGLDEALRIAAGREATVRLLHVMNDFPVFLDTVPAAMVQDTWDRIEQSGAALLEQAQRRVRDAGARCETRLARLTEGRVAQQIVDDARATGCDLIVLGTHGRRGFNRLAMGSDAELVARLAEVPVLLVRGGVTG